MASMFLQVESPSIMFKDLLEPISGPLTVFIILGLIVFAFIKRRNYNRRLFNAITRPTVIVQQVANQSASPFQINFSEMNMEEFNKLSWEEREAIYIQRIIQLKDSNRKLRDRLVEAGLVMD